MFQPMDLCGIEEFTKHLDANVRRLKLTSRPQVLTVGKTHLVVQEAGSYRKLIDTLMTCRSTTLRLNRQLR